MNVVIDTNVFISGIFFGGPPHRIIEAWRDTAIR
jgi:predicted nucleic acid-binding protein